ncbi:MAG: serine hydrolase domain-containing protein [Pseudomonadota bacterium]
MEHVTPEDVGLSSERLARLSTWLDEQISSNRLSGASVLIGRRGKVAYMSTAGLAVQGTDQAFSADTVVRIFSMTKAITTVAAMMLYERGSFQLDDPVSMYIPAFADTPVWRGGDHSLEDTVPQATPMTVRHLMTHTSGLTYAFMRSTPVDKAYRAKGIDLPGAASNLEAFVDLLAGVPLLSQPGSQWNYSLSTDVLGRLVEIWSGCSLGQFFAAEIFEPLGMQETGFHVVPELRERFAALYAPLTGADMSNVGNKSKSAQDTVEVGLSLQDGPEGSRYLEPPASFSGGGGLTSTIGDYARFCQMLLNKGELDGARLLSRKTVEYMRLNHLPDNKDMAAMGQPVWSETSYDGIGFGLGFAVVLDPVKAHIVTSVGEHHWGGAASTFFWIDPEEDMYVVFYTQLIPSSTYPIRRELRTRVYQALID